MSPRPVYPPADPGVFRLSQSSLEEFLRCGIKFELQLEAPHRRATVRMMIGSAVAVGAREDNREKLRGKAGLPLGDLVDAAVAGYVDEVEASEVASSKYEIDAGKDDAANAARTYGIMVSPRMRDVIAAEEPIVAELGDGVELAGTADVVTIEGIGDTKVGRPWKQADADASRQLSAYAILHLARYGKFPERLWIDSIQRDGAMWRWRRHWTSRGPDDLEAYLRIVARARKAIEAGAFLPAPAGAWWCSARWCAFYGRGCPVTTLKRG